MKLLLSYIVLTAIAFNAFALGRSTDIKPSKPLSPDEKAWKWADKTLKKMTVEEKVGQIIHVGINAKFANQDSDFFQNLKHDVVDNKVGGILLFGAPVYESVQIINRMQELAKIPLLISVDAETGVGMRFDDTINFPWNMAVAATGNPDYAYRIGVVTGREAKAMGIQHVFAPVLDINNNADNPVINVRSYSEDPETVAKFGVAFMEGLQSQGVLATAKHFPGHGDTNIDSHRGLPMIDHPRSSLDKTELVPFRQAIMAGIGSIMIAHIGLPQIDPTEITQIKNPVRVDAEEGAEVTRAKATVPATLSPVVQTELLKKELGFKGLVVTDAMGMSGLTLYVDQREAGVRAFLAGADILEKPADTEAMRLGMIDAVKNGRISQARLDESVRKILAWKYTLGLSKKVVTPIDQLDRVVSSRDVLALTDEVASHAITLVRNDANALPLDKSKRVFVLGLSNGTDGDLTASSLNQELRKIGVTASGIVLQDNSTAEQVTRARALARNADIVIAGLYGRVRSGARNSAGIPEAGLRLLRDLMASGKTVVGVSYGNPYVLGAVPELKTYVVAYGDMPSLQRASARALFGVQDITGRLPITLPGLYPRGTGLTLNKKA